MGVAGGIFNIIQRSQLSVTATATLRVTQTQKSLIQKSAADNSAGLNPTSWTLRKNESAVAAFWRLAPESAAKNAPTVDIVKRLEKLATEKADVEGQLAGPGLAGEQFAELGRRLSHVQAEVAMLEERWLELHEALEAIPAD